MKNKQFKFISERFLVGSLKMQFTALFIFTLIIVIMGSLLVVVFTEYNFPDALWWAFLRITDPGNLSQDKATSFRFIGTFVAITGWVIFGLLISIISTTFQVKFNEMQKGRSAVTFDNHVIVLGWNHNVYTVLDELTLSQDSSNVPIVVMSNKSAEEMYNEIKSFCKPNTINYIICKNGSPESLIDQKRLNIVKASSIIILNNYLELGSFNADAAALKTILAYNKNVKDDLSPIIGDKNHKVTSVIVEISEPVYLEYIRGIISLENNKHNIKFFPIVTTEILGKILASCALQPGLSKIYQELFSYYRCDRVDQGNTSEIYVQPLSSANIREPMDFEEIIYGSDNAIPIGFIKAGEAPVINPPFVTDTQIHLLNPATDCLVYIADDSRPIIIEQRINDIPDIQLPNFINTEAGEKRNILIIGSGYKTEVVLKELLSFLSDDSKITCSDQFENRLISGQRANEVNADIIITFYNMGEIDSIINYLVMGENLDFDLIIFAEDVLDPSNHDARSLMCLAGINSAFNNRKKKPRIVMELYDSDNVELAQTANADDVIIGSELLSDYLVQIARVPERHLFYSELLTADGSEIYIKPITLYKTDENAITFKELTIAARKRNEIAIGYSFYENSQFKYVINPPKQMRYNQNNHIQYAIVLAEDAK